MILHMGVYLRAKFNVSEKPTQIRIKWIWIEDISEFDEIFIDSYNEESDEDIFLKLIPNTHESFHNDLPFLPERIKILTR